MREREREREGGGGGVGERETMIIIQQKGIKTYYFLSPILSWSSKCYSWTTSTKDTTIKHQQ